MGKISSFRKAMRLDKAASKHSFKNFITPAVSDVHSGYIQDMLYNHIRKNMGKSINGPLLRPCR